MDKKIAAVTGANRGIGWGVSQALAELGFHVLLLGRNEEALKKRQNELKESSVFALDVADARSTEEFKEWLYKKIGRVDAFVNCAGVFLDDKEASFKDVSALNVSPETVLKTFTTNTLGPYRLCQIVLPLMKKQRYGRIVNVSSGMGALTDMNGMYPAYRISKTALNAVTRVFAEELKGINIKINSVCPGWVRTDMGGPNAERTIEQGAKGIVWAATLPDDGPSGGFFRDGEPIPW